ncbi:hypothetical protein HanRHA438_Chr01g0005011 [Helianthus annuus]|uniref:Uncharacterized protein n=1 Tax=Helianthus annuus TaxID=4232 RepID=A0A251VBY4_HELAN|nr:hypothetical protein HanXRQr2_Chr03g0137891 [Helianthus annuus]KAJ0946013.1 hypothetical protein HanPSC8_Chr03g0134461 [Helianthus annuus]KAJ0946534.1 hypothetical protein HanRHA438_Chr01g0005011 [Helianthus annuus]
MRERRDTERENGDERRGRRLRHRRRRRRQWAAVMVVQQSWVLDSTPAGVVRLGSGSGHISAQVIWFRLTSGCFGT